MTDTRAQRGEICPRSGPEVIGLGSPQADGYREAPASHPQENVIPGTISRRADLGQGDLPEAARFHSCLNRGDRPDGNHSLEETPLATRGTTSALCREKNLAPGTDSSGSGEDARTCALGRVPAIRLCLFSSQPARHVLYKGVNHT